MFANLLERKISFDKRTLQQFAQNQEIEEVLWKSYQLANVIAGIKEHIPGIATVIAGYHQELLAAIMMAYQYEGMRAIQLDLLGNIIHGAINRHDRIYIVDWTENCVRYFNNYFSPVGACIVKQTFPRDTITIENVQYLLEL